MKKTINARGKPFQSKLNPFLRQIHEGRLARKTWREIAEGITAQGVPTDARRVFEFYKKKLIRPAPIGFPNPLADLPPANQGKERGGEPPTEDQPEKPAPPLTVFKPKKKTRPPISMEDLTLKDPSAD